MKPTVSNLIIKIGRSVKPHDVHSTKWWQRRRKWQSTPVFLPGKSHGWRSLVGYRPWGHKELDTTGWLHFHFSTSYSSLYKLYGAKPGHELTFIKGQSSCAEINFLKNCYHLLNAYKPQSIGRTVSQAISFIYELHLIERSIFHDNL